MKKMKHALGTWTGFALVMAVAVCTGSLAQEDSGNPAVTIEVGMLGASDKDGAEEWFMGELRAFREAHPNIGVTTLAIGGPSRYERRVESMPALAKNVIGIDGWSGYEAAYLASRDLIVPLDDYLLDPSFDLDAFPENLFDAVTYNGKVWGIPWATLLSSLTVIEGST